MGREKALLELRGKQLLDHLREAADQVCSDIYLVGRKEKFGSEAIEDLFPGQGPLAGMHAALQHSQMEWNLILAVDIPLVTREFLDFLIARALRSQAEAVVPRTAKGWQPLCAVYRRSFGAHAQRALARQQNKIDALFSQASIEPVEEAEMRAAGFDPDVLLQNVNTPEDLERVRATLEPGARP
jgi:molybdopterin-guanine dinucleotide biosynthesis protein A